jgi:hypothetical protein
MQPPDQASSNNSSAATAPPGVRQLEVPSRLRAAKKRIPAPVKALARATTRGYGVATSPLRTDPDFLIVGTKRGGTTSLWNALVAHPDVLAMFPATQEIKSPHYFDIHYDKGRAWYRSHFATRRQRERHERRTGRTAVTGEASPYYMFHPLAPERIAHDLPAVRVVMSLRNPVERIWSHYHERVAGRTETLSFKAALEAEQDRLSGEEERIRAEAPGYYSFHHDLSSYLARGRYAEHVRRVIEVIPAERLLILRAEDFYADSAGELRRLFAFLGISEHAVQAPHYNRLPRSSMPDDVRAQLEDYYRPHVAELEALLGRRMQWFD